MRDMATEKLEERENIEKSEKDPTELRVKSRTSVKSLAGAITATLKEHGCATLRCIGDGAIGRAVRASAISKGHLASIGVNLVIEPSYFMAEIDGQERTGIQMIVEDR